MRIPGVPPQQQREREHQQQVRLPSSPLVSLTRHSRELIISSITLTTHWQELGIPAVLVLVVLLFYADPAGAAAGATGTSLLLRSPLPSK